MDKHITLSAKEFKLNDTGVGNYSEDVSVLDVVGQRFQSFLDRFHHRKVMKRGEVESGRAN